MARISLFLLAALLSSAFLGFLSPSNAAPASRQRISHQLAGAQQSPQAIALTCARRAKGNVQVFNTCVGKRVVLRKNQTRVVACAQSNRTAKGFAVCAAPSLGLRLSKEHRVVAGCAMQASGDANRFKSCLGFSLNRQLNSDQRAVFDCTRSSGGSTARFTSCAVKRVLGARATNEQRIALQCASESRDLSSFSTCTGAKVLGAKLNPEQQIAVQCVTQFGGQPQAAATCMASRLTAREFTKCITDGVGGSGGCFGDSNDLVGNNGWTARKLNDAASDIKKGPGDSNDVVGKDGWLRKRLGI